MFTRRNPSAERLGLRNIERREIDEARRKDAQYRHEARKRLNNPMPETPSIPAGGIPRKEALRAVDTQCERGAFGSA